MCFLEYFPSHKTYKCLRLKDSTIIISKHVQFFEDTIPFKDYKTDDLPSKEMVQKMHLPLSSNLQIQTNDISPQNVDNQTTSSIDFESFSSNQSNPSTS